MPQVNKPRFTEKQRRQAEHIEAGYEKKGLGEKESEAIAWATVKKLSAAGKKSGPAKKNNQSL